MCTLGNTQSLEPVKGMPVTLFVAKGSNTVNVVIGEQSVEEIEELYHTNSTGGIILLCVFIAGILAIIFYPKEKVKIIHADR